MTKEKIKVHDTLDTLVEWFGDIVPKSTYRKLREGANEVSNWIGANKDE